jgi:hypothetical protein
METANVLLLKMLSSNAQERVSKACVKIEAALSLKLGTLNVSMTV